MAAELAENPTENISAPRGETASQEYRWTTDRFYRAANAGVFDDPSRLELIYGKIIEKMPQSSLHRAVRLRISRLLRPMFAPSLTVADECPIHISFDGEPVPDIVVLRGAVAEDPVRHPAPEDAALLIEIAVSSAGYDTGGKTLLYAQAGIADYWVVLPDRGQVVVHREPSEAGYVFVQALTLEDTVAPLAAPEAVLPVRELLGG